MPEFGQLFAVGGVLLLLAVSLYFLRRKGHARFGFRTAGGAQGARQLQSIERLPLTSQHSLHLIRVYGRTVLIAVSPGGCSVLDGSAWTTATEERTAVR
ncbi:MAG TPA: flagellar biosynthetic protein FliO [Bryobacteraceae bacterium]|jgi:flagellar biogenesis protein FliO